MSAVSTIAVASFRWVLFLVAFASISFQVVLTRIFSLILYYDFVFLAVSFAILGLGLGAMVATLPWCNQRRELPAAWLGFYALALPASALTIVFLPHSPTSYVVWILFGAASLPPFMLMGLIAAHIYRLTPQQSGTLYAHDLVGASLGALAAIPGLTLGPFRYTFVLAAIILLFSAAAGVKAPIRSLRPRAMLGGLAIVFAAMALAPPVDPLLDRFLLSRWGPGKPLFDLLEKRNATIEDTRWSSISRVDLVAEPGRALKEIYTDASVPAVMRQFDGQWETLSDLRGFVGFAPFTYGPVDSVLSIGSGAGIDILLGKLAGASSITAVELNRDMVDIVRQHADYNGNVLDLPGTKVVVDEGRAFVRASNAHYDLILFLLAQGNSAEISGSVMTDNYLMTQEAFGEYYERLGARGRLAIAVHSPHRVARFIVNWATMLSQQGASLRDAVQRTALLVYPDEAYRFLLVFHRDIPTVQDRQALEQFVEATPSTAIFIPGVQENDPKLAAMARGTLSIDEFIRDFPGGVNVRPTTDDKPFQNDIYEGVNPPLRVLLAVVVFSLLLVIGLPYSNRAVRREGSRFLLWAIYFSAIGMGFIIVEVILMRRLMLYLGHPALALVVVLFSLLLSAGLGSALSQRFVRRQATRGIVWVLFGLSLALVFYQPLAISIMESFLSSHIFARSAAAAALLCLPGFFLGMPFPVGMARCATELQVGNTWMWGINGVASITGSVLAMVTALKLGMSTALLLAAACYMAAGLVGVLRWKQG